MVQFNHFRFKNTTTSKLILNYLTKLNATYRNLLTQSFLPYSFNPLTQVSHSSKGPYRFIIDYLKNFLIAPKLVFDITLSVRPPDTGLSTGQAAVHALRPPGAQPKI